MSECGTGRFGDFDFSWPTQKSMWMVCWLVTLEKFSSGMS